MANRKISVLAEELKDFVNEIAALADRAYYVFNADDFEQIAGLGDGQAAVGIAYEGKFPIEPGDSNKRPIAGDAKGVVMYKVVFSLIVAVPYSNASAASLDGQTDPKDSVTDLLDAVSAAILGRKGVNLYPWAFGGELPVDGRLEGMIFYGQTWSTVVSLVGNH